MSVEQMLRAAGGITRTALLEHRGYSQYKIKQAEVRSGLVRPRRGWIAFPGTDPALLTAARLGAVIACISQAKRLGLWVLEEPETHYAAPRGRQIPNARVHRRRPLTPRAPELLEDSLVNVLDCVAHCRPTEEALAIWDSALQRGLIGLPRLESLPFGPKARKLLRRATPFSDSGLETFVRERLRWLRERLLSQVWIAGHRVDFLLGDRLVLQIDGRDHVGAQRITDNQHDAELRNLGYTVLRFTYEEIVYDWPRVNAAILAAIEHGLHLAR